MSTSAFLSCFSRINPDLPDEIVSIERRDFSFDIRVFNVVKTEGTERLLSSFFGGATFSIDLVPDSQDLLISVSRVKVPSTSYSVLQILKLCEENSHKGWLTGVSSFGPDFFDLNDLTHACLFGASGYGKSNFFRYLIAQTLAFHSDTVNFIIDPKQIDFKVFEVHPRVAKVITGSQEWISLFANLIVEMGFREHLFSSSFEMPPVDLKEYQKLRKSLKKENELPDLPRLLIWVDESHMIYSSTSGYGPGLDEIVNPLIKKGRSFGIHFIHASQRLGDIPSSIRSQSNTIFSFYSTEPHHSAYSDVQSFEKYRLCRRGHLVYFNPTLAKIFQCQTPLISPEESISIAFGFSNTSNFPKQGLTRLTIRKDWVSPPVLALQLAGGITFKTLIESPQNNIKEPSMRSLSIKENLLAHYYDLVEHSPAALAVATFTPSKEQDDLLGDLDVLLEPARKIAALPPSKPVATSSAIPAAEPVATSAPVPAVKPILVLPKTPFIKNMPAIDKLVDSFKKAYKNAPTSFEWLLRDMSNNAGLTSLLTTFRTNRTNQNETHPLDVNSLVLDVINHQKLQQFIDEIQKGNLIRKPSLLIISGPEGSGRHALIEAVSKMLNIKVRVATSEDLHDMTTTKDIDVLRELQANSLTEGEPITQSKKPKKEPCLLLFDHELTGIQYYRHTNSAQIPIIINTLEPNPFSALFGTANSRDYKYLTEPHIHLSLSMQTWNKIEILELLISSLLYQNGFAGTKGQWARHFQSCGIKTLPSSVNSVIERAKKRALYMNKAFDNATLDETLLHYKLEKSLARTNKVTITQPTKKLSNLTVCNETLRDVEDIIFRAKHLNNVSYDFILNLRKKGRMVALFCGPPGTGKSLAAEVVATESGKELWVTSFDKIVGGIVGQTEESLTEIFLTAAAAEAVLLIDEADAFLGNRENSQAEYTLRWTNHLLNLIENYSGILILTTNHATNIDEAFSRRIDIKAAFFEPSEEQLALMLENLLKPDAPLAPNFNVANVVKGISLSGGLLRNALERAVLKMERLSLKELTEDFVRQALLETHAENKLVKGHSRQIGIGMQN